MIVVGAVKSSITGQGGGKDVKFLKDGMFW